MPLPSGCGLDYRGKTAAFALLLIPAGTVAACLRMKPRAAMAPAGNCSSRPHDTHQARTPSGSIGILRGIRKQAKGRFGMKSTTNTQRQNRIINSSQNKDHAILCALVARLRTRDAETLEHSERVVRLSLILGREFGLNSNEMRSLKYGSLLHDIGKIGVPDSILRKPGRLTSDEWNKMREHPLLGLKILSGIDFLRSASLVVVQHHERWDGKGYPFGLQGNEIDRNARIFAVADAFDAMTSERVYHAGKSFEAAAAELRRCAGRQFDPEVVEAFSRLPVPTKKYISGVIIEAGTLDC